MYHFIPNITGNHLGPYVVLDNFKQVLPKDTTLTCDSWFGMKSWMECNKTLPFTCAMPETQGGGLWKLFTYTLEKNQFRTFYNGKFFLTVFMSESLMVTGSTVFRLSNRDESVLSPNQARTTNVLPSSLQLNEDAISLLKQFPKEDLIKLAVALGKPSGMMFRYVCNNLGGTVQELALLIGGQSLTTSTISPESMVRKRGKNQKVFTFHPYYL